MVTKYQVKDALKTNKQKVEAELEHIQKFISQPGLIISDETLGFIEEEVKAMKDYADALGKLIVDINTSGLPVAPPAPKMGNVTVHYVDESNVDIAQMETHTEQVGTAYSFTAKTIDGYTLKTDAANKTGEYTEEPIEVKFIYSKDPIKVTSVDLKPKTATVKVGETTQLKATLLPDNADNKEVTFKSSNEAVATVDSNGLVTAVAEGEADITVTTKDGNFTKSAKITVPAAEAE